MQNKSLEFFGGDELISSVYLSKYALKDKQGNIIEEDPKQMFERLSKTFYEKELSLIKALPESKKQNLSYYGKKRSILTYDKIYDYISSFKLLFGGSINAGIDSGNLVSLSNCFVISSPEDSYCSIMDRRKDQVNLMKRRGGVGYDLSNLRPRGTNVNNAASTSTGAASFMNLNSEITKEVAQDGRRGALLMSININHPDSLEFIQSKQDLTKITGANISVKVDDEFIEAVKEDRDYFLRWPCDIKLNERYVDGLSRENGVGFYEKDFPKVYNKLIEIEDLQHYELYGEHKTYCYIKRVRAKELWNELMKCAWNTAEPGILFVSRIIDYSPEGLYDKFKFVSSNPYGEIPMGENDSCRLLHINLTKYVIDPFTDKSHFDYNKFYEDCYEFTRIGDDLIELELDYLYKIISKVEDSEKEVWQKIYNTTYLGRRLGFGFTGLGDCLAMLGHVYHSPLMIESILQTKYKAEWNCSIDLSIERGKFEAFDKTKLDNSWFRFMKNNYPEIYERLETFGCRNISISTVAPTGTVSILAGNITSGIEPLFQPFYKRSKKVKEGEQHDYIDNVGEKFKEFIVIHPMFKEYLKIRYNFTNDEIKELELPYLELVFKDSPYYQNTAEDINWKDRIDVQSIIQKFTSHAISSTINLHKDTKVEEINDLYLYAHSKGLKGVTIYRDTCRTGILNKIDNNNKKEEEFKTHNAPKRIQNLKAELQTVKVKGQYYIVIVGLLNNKPYEVFAFKTDSFKEKHFGEIAKIKKGYYSFGSDSWIISNITSRESIEEKACTLYTSMLLRHGVEIEYIIKTIKKVDDNIASFSSAICRVLNKYIPSKELNELCPECNNKLTRSEGCIKCTSCGYSKCS